MKLIEKRFLIISVIIAFFLSSIFHFVFDFVGRPALLAGLFPISESIWEHLKLPFFSLLLVIIVPWNNYLKDKTLCQRIKMIAVSSFISMTIIFFGYYGLKCGLGIEGFLIDLLLLAIGLIVGMIHAIMIGNMQESKSVCILSLIFIIGMILLFYYFSYQIPDLPGFISA